MQRGSYVGHENIDDAVDVPEQLSNAASAFCLGLIQQSGKSFVPSPTTGLDSSDDGWLSMTLDRGSCVLASQQGSSTKHRLTRNLAMNFDNYSLKAIRLWEISCERDMPRLPIPQQSPANHLPHRVVIVRRRVAMPPSPADRDRGLTIPESGKEGGH